MMEAIFGKRTSVCKGKLFNNVFSHENHWVDNPGFLYRRKGFLIIEPN